MYLNIKKGDKVYVYLHDDTHKIEERLVTTVRAIYISDNISVWWDHPKRGKVSWKISSNTNTPLIDCKHSGKVFRKANK
jgi:hypothetical protein